MKVYELIARLEKASAGAEVVVGMMGTLNASVVDVQVDDGSGPDDLGQVVITGGDAELIDDNGNEMGTLSYHTSVESEDDE